MDRIFERAAEWGIETQHVDGLGRRRVVEPQVLARILDSMAAGGAVPPVPSVTPPVVPQRAYQGADGALRRTWALSAQLCGVRSCRHRGHGVFFDLDLLYE